MWYTKNRLIRGFSDAQARLLGWTTANMISVYRILMAAAFPFLAASGLTALAAAVFAVAVYLDYIDGAVARYQQDTLGHRTDPDAEAAMPFLSRLSLKGCTETGAWLDPLADKLLVQSALFSLGWGRIPWWLLASGLGFAVLLTAARPFKAWLKRKGLRKSADGRANAFGKIKMWLEVAAVGLLFFDPSSAIHDAMLWILAMSVLSSATLMAFLSLVFHLLPAREKK